ncbi:MAG TPA: CHRD domain-containing protein [Phenylobacterium sp.]|nr:CHRD domain-containing protein [Phenylobacterium sp.]
MNSNFLRLGLAAALAGGLGLAATVASAAETTLHATLSGPGGGSGTATVRVDEAKNQVCWDLSAKGLSDVTMAHIHKGAAGANGPPVVPFKPVDASGASKGCGTATADVAKDLVANPANYYVNVHTKAAPGGAIRGQLGK